ncbi:MAG: GLPGLI family protein [Lactococcus lactis]|nr:GLPGLI family protein [Lactococcus lactis]
MHKKIILLLFFMITSLKATSQSKINHASTKVDYAIQIHFDKSKKIYEVYEKYRPGLVAEAESIASELDFSLIFNDSISVFYLEKKLFSDNRAASFAIRESGYYGRIKQQSNNYITEELQESFGKFLVSRPYHEWELQDETKVIGDYTCFKATTSYNITTPKGKVFKRNFTAWYTPQLPYSFGPAGFGDLPGLIIELQGDEFTYGIKKIKFFDKEEKSKENEIPRLKRKKLITEEEFEKLAAEDEKRWRKD